MLPLNTTAECNAYDNDPVGGTNIPSRCMIMYGGTIAGISVPVHDCVATNKCNDPSVDDYASITIDYTVGSGPGSSSCLGGTFRLARLAGLGRGAGPRCLDISGGPYHIKWTASDGASIGNRDNQIMGSAIIFQDTGLATTPDPTSGTVGVTLNDSANLTGPPRRRRGISHSTSMTMPTAQHRQITRKLFQSTVPGSTQRAQVG